MLKIKFILLIFTIILCKFLLTHGGTSRIELPKSYVPSVGNPINRNYSAILQLSLNITQKTDLLDSLNNYDFWTFDGSVPGPFIRARVGDTLEASLTNFGNETHDIDFHAVTGPGGGGAILATMPNSTTKGSFKLLSPGLFLYHCGSLPVALHMANGLYGLMLVEPSTPLPPVDKEFYLMRSEFYTEPPKNKFLQISAQNGLNEQPQFVVFNGKMTSLIDKPLTAKTGDKIRIYVGNAGPNQVASFHIIGIIFSNVYREGDLVSPPAKNVQTTLIPAGGTAVVEFQVLVLGSYAIVDHSVFRIPKGAFGLLNVEGPVRPDIYCRHVNDTCQYEDMIFKADFDDTVTTTSSTPKPSPDRTTTLSKNNAGGSFYSSIYFHVIFCPLFLMLIVV